MIMFRESARSSFLGEAKRIDIGEDHDDPATQERTPQQYGVALPQVRLTIGARARRRAFFKSDLFSDPAWDILLRLFECELSGRRISAAQVCDHVPQTTRLRWIVALENEGLIVRRLDWRDSRRLLLFLSESGREAMFEYFEGQDWISSRGEPHGQ
jgi:DNA-binding MarR family transcriptional regulator